MSGSRTSVRIAVAVGFAARDLAALLRRVDLVGHAQFGALDDGEAVGLRLVRGLEQLGVMQRRLRGGARFEHFRRRARFGQARACPVDERRQRTGRTGSEWRRRRSSESEGDGHREGSRDRGPSASVTRDCSGYVSSTQEVAWDARGSLRLGQAASWSQPLSQPPREVGTRYFLLISYGYAVLSQPVPCPNGVTILPIGKCMTTQNEWSSIFPTCMLDPVGT